MEDKIPLIIVLLFSPIGWIGAIIAVNLIIAISTHIKYLITGKL